MTSDMVPNAKINETELASLVGLPVHSNKMTQLLLDTIFECNDNEAEN